MKHFAPHIALLSLMIFAACGTSRDYDPEWGSEELAAGGKMDGLADDARVIEFGAASQGAVASTSIELFSMNVVAGDRFELEVEATSGDLNPHLTLHRGGFSSVSSESFALDGQKVTKTYVAASTGTYFVAVRAFRNEGAGQFSLRASCMGGPCAGEFPDVEPEPLNEEAVHGCLDQAFSCALEDIKRFNGAVGPVRAARAIHQCLETDSFCAGMCDSSQPSLFEDETAEEIALDVCSAMTVDLQFYADQSDACLEVLDDCFDACGDGDLGSIFGYCYLFGFNGTCPNYARGRVECGGPFAEGSDAECHLFCESTVGVHNDDLDVMCEEECNSERPDILEDEGF